MTSQVTVILYDTLNGQECYVPIDDDTGLQLQDGTIHILNSETFIQLNHLIKYVDSRKYTAFETALDSYYDNLLGQGLDGPALTKLSTYFSHIKDFAKQSTTAHVEVYTSNPYSLGDYETLYLRIAEKFVIPTAAFTGNYAHLTVIGLIPAKG